MRRHEYVILGDVIASREIDDREAFRDTIEAALEAVNDRYADDVVGEFALLKGVDEIAGVIDDPRNLYRILRDVVSATRPGAIRFSVVYDEIDVGTAGDAAGEMDGPAFHRADEALVDVAEAELYVSFSGRRPAFDPLIGACINLLLVAREDWTERQRAMVAAYEETGTQNAVADRFDVSQQTVSATLRRADWPRLSRLEGDVNETLARYASGDDDQEAGGGQNHSEALEVGDGRE